MSFSVAIVGRPNVGKSTLFNRLVGRRLAIVDDRPGVTRDRREGRASIGDLVFRVIDTAGFEGEVQASLEDAIRAQTDRAIAEADVVLMLIDARAGVTPVDERFAALLRRSHKAVILVANKAEGRAGAAGYYDAFTLGLGDPVAISAEHGEGMGELFEAIDAASAPFRATEADADEPGGDEPEGELTEDEELEARLDADAGPAVLALAIVGRPNVGKSTLVNRLLDEERVLTGPEPGVTRDSISIDWQWHDRPVRLVDTAGMRRQARVSDRIERLSVEDTRRAIRFAHVIALVLDAEQGLERQDLTIARQVVDEGRALVIALNKWDLVRDPDETLGRLRDRLQISLPQARGLPVVTLSGLTGLRVERLMQAVTGIYDVWNTRVSTGALNRWLSERLEANPPPLSAGRRIRLRYMTQIKRRPPTFALFTSKPEDLPESYLRYLINGLRDDFGMAGVPIRINLRKGRNPYAGRR